MNRFHDALLRLLPAEFRTRFGPAMRDFHRDRLAEARRAGDSIAVTWLRIIADVISTAVVERLRPSFHPHSDSYREPRTMHNLIQDMSYALRGLARRPAFALIVVGTIALGVGANAAIFSVVSGVLLRPLPYPHAERVFAFGHEPPHWLASNRDFADYKRGIPSIERLGAYTSADATLSGDGEPQRVRATRGSEEFFPALGVNAALGRTFAPDEFSGSGLRNVILSHPFWLRRFGGDTAIVGKTITINGTPRTVVGVMPPHFNFPEARTDIWVPLPRVHPDSLGDRNNHFLFMVGRLRADATLERARTEAMHVARTIMTTEPQNFDPKAPIVPTLTGVSERLVGKTRPYLFALLGAVALVLLIACANVANLLLVRGETRRREMGLRTALGASRSRLFVQLFTEGVVLSGLGAALGLVVAWAASQVLVAAAPSSVPRMDEVSLDWRVVLYTGIAMTVTALFVGALPALRAMNDAPVDALKEVGRTPLRRSGVGARQVLVIAEVALAVVVLSGAGMLLRSLMHLREGGTGFDPEGVVTARVSLPARQYTNDRNADFFRRLAADLRALPGVQAVGASGWLPVVDAGGLWQFRPDGRTYHDYDGRWPSAVPQQVTPGYFEAAGIRMIAGRDFTNADQAGASLVAVVSEKFAELAWPSQNAIGKRFGLGPDFLTVVGVVADIRQRGYGDIPEPTMYFPHAQSAQSAYYMPVAMSLLVRTAGDPMAFVPAIRAAVRRLDANVPVSEVRTLDYIVGTSVANRRFSTSLLLGFAALALLLAGIGTYGVMSYGVAQRRFEIGVRMALGAERHRVVSMVLREGALLAVIGLGIGLGGALVIGRLIRSLLVGVSPFDAPTFVAVAIVLVLVALLAALVPARRASGVSPVDALRSD
jgi:putative ABC transport system permease protein